jgi:hypothetical protein
MEDFIIVTTTLRDAVGSWKAMRYAICDTCDGNYANDAGCSSARWLMVNKFTGVCVPVLS